MPRRHPGQAGSQAPELALYTGRVGDPAAARDQLAALLPVAEGVLGPAHRYTVLIRAALDSWTRQAGRGSGQPP